MDSFYRDLILDHYKNPQNFGKINNPSASYKLHNSACGDVIQIYILAKDKKIENIKFKGEGCAISIASASLLTEHVLGKNIDEILKMNKDDILKLLGVTLTPTRLKCALLSLEVLHKAVHLLQ